MDCARTRTGHGADGADGDAPTVRSRAADEVARLRRPLPTIRVWALAWRLRAARRTCRHLPHPPRPQPEVVEAHPLDEARRDAAALSRAAAVGSSSHHTPRASTPGSLRRRSTISPRG